MDRYEEDVKRSVGEETEMHILSLTIFRLYLKYFHKNYQGAQNLREQTSDFRFSPPVYSTILKGQSIQQ